MTDVLQHPGPETLLHSAEKLPNSRETIDLAAHTILEGLPNDVKPWTPEEGEQAYKVGLWEPEVPQSPLDTETLEFIKNLYARGAARKYARDAWWLSAERTLKQRDVDEQTASELMSLRQAYEVEVEVSGKYEGSYELFACGTDRYAELTSEEQDTITSTIEVIDQMSGGALLSRPGTKRIVTLGGVYIPHPLRREPLGGTATSDLALINISGLRQIAEQSGVDPQALLSVVVTHELLGHKLEDLLDGNRGDWFEKFFEYSKDRRLGKDFDTIHTEIKARGDTDEARASRPVREYGYVNSREDTATSIDALVGSVYGWDDKLKGSNRFAGEPDAFRSEIAMNLFNEVAARVHEATKGRGSSTISSPIEYQGSGAELRVVRARKYKVTEKNFEEVVSEEVQRIAAPFKGLDHIYYTTYSAELDLA